MVKFNKLYKIRNVEYIKEIYLRFIKDIFIKINFIFFYPYQDGNTGSADLYGTNWFDNFYLNERVRKEYKNQLKKINENKVDVFEAYQKIILSQKT